MDCLESAKEFNITYFLQGQTRLKKTATGTHNHLVHKQTLNHLVKLGQRTGQTYGSTIWLKYWPSIAKWLSVPFPTKWLCLQILLQSLAHQIS